MTINIKIGDKVLASKMPQDSFYEQAIGTVTDIRNGFVSIDATMILAKNTTKFEEHPTKCSTSTKIENITLNFTNMSNVNA